MSNEIAKLSGQIEPSVIEGEVIAGRVIRDGNVAVIFSPGFGAGWSSWIYNDKQRQLAPFDPVIVRWIENGKIGDPDLSHYGDDEPYSGGLRKAQIEWIPEGTYFRINEYDGSESIEYLSPVKYFRA